MSKKKMFKLKSEEDDCFEILIADQEKNLTTREFLKNNPEYKRYDDIIKLNLMSSKAVYTVDNDVELYFSGEDKFTALFESIRNAKRYIHMEYYIFHSDKIGGKVIDALAQKATEGVEIGRAHF